MLTLPSALEKLPKSPEIPVSSEVWIKRDDRIHPIISGNKARKLAALLKQIEDHKPARILSMGGNRSNFLHALAYICHSKQIELHALIRGHQPAVFHNTLQDLKNWGTNLSFIDKETFRQLRSNTEMALAKARELDAIWLPEGGSNTDALHGIIAAVDELEFAPNQLFVPVGTGCTALGLALGCKQRGWHTRIMGIVVLKQAQGLQDSLQQLATDAGYSYPDNLVLEHNFCGSGFGKVTPEIRRQQSEYEGIYKLPLEPVYSIKMFNAFLSYGRNNLLSNKVIIWHTGGLQGR